MLPAVAAPPLPIPTAIRAHQVREPSNLWSVRQPLRCLVFVGNTEKRARSIPSSFPAAGVKLLAAGRSRAGQGSRRTISAASRSAGGTGVEQPRAHLLPHASTLPARAAPRQPLAHGAEVGSAAAARCEGDRTLNSQAGSGATRLPGTALAGSRTSLCSELWAFGCVSARTGVPKTSDGFIGIGITASFHAFQQRQLC